ncbi:hypothetical protein BDW22DRAFT_1350997 [Trametopsis cervina]|nr:hypothetical protein BDW22DRAFT_1350997 [Trametopsis cervina]
MAPIRLLNLFAVLSVALLASTFNVPVAALSNTHGHPHLNRQLDHSEIARKVSKRGTSKRCKPKTSAPGTTSTPVITTTVSLPPPVKTTSAKPPPPTTSPASPPPPPPPSGNKKLLVGWNNQADIGVTVGKNTWGYYTWSSWAVTPSHNLPFLSMLWGGSSDKISQFETNIKGPGDGRWILGFNEPNEDSQSKMDVGTAVSVWNQHIQPKKNAGFNLVSPAPTNSPTGKTWLQAFFAQCGGCTIDAVAVHIYTTSSKDAIDFINDYHTTFNRPIMVTEFACQNFGGGAQCSQDQAWSFYQDILGFAQATPWIIAVAPFSLLNDMGNVSPVNQGLRDSQLTDLGQFIVNGNW